MYRTVQYERYRYLRIYLFIHGIIEVQVYDDLNAVPLGLLQPLQLQTPQLILAQPSKRISQIPDKNKLIPVPISSQKHSISNTKLKTDYRYSLNFLTHLLKTFTNLKIRNLPV